jgi:hypothetical protein
VKGRSAKKATGVKTVRIWGSFDDAPSDLDGNKVPRMPNPVPDNIVSLLKLAGEATWLTIPLAPYIYLLIRSWFEGRNSRKLKLRNGDFEIEVQGTWSDRKLRKESQKSEQAHTGNRGEHGRLGAHSGAPPSRDSAVRIFRMPRFHIDPTNASPAPVSLVLPIKLAHHLRNN